jgi:hypothetical protein
MLVQRPANNPYVSTAGYGHWQPDKLSYFYESLIDSDIGLLRKTMNNDSTPEEHSGVFRYRAVDPESGGRERLGMVALMGLFISRTR